MRHQLCEGACPGHVCSATFVVSWQPFSTVVNTNNLKKKNTCRRLLYATCLPRVYIRKISLVVNAPRRPLLDRQRASIRKQQTCSRSSCRVSVMPRGCHVAEKNQKLRSPHPEHGRIEMLLTSSVQGVMCVFILPEYSNLCCIPIRSRCAVVLILSRYSKACCTADYLPIQQSLLYCGFSSYTAVPAVLLILLRCSTYTARTAVFIFRYSKACCTAGFLPTQQCMLHC